MRQLLFRDHQDHRDVLRQVHLHRRQVHWGHRDVALRHQILDVAVPKIYMAIHLVVDLRHHQDHRVHQDAHLVVVVQQNQDALHLDVSPPLVDADRGELFDLDQDVAALALQLFQKDCFQLLADVASAASAKD
jgi:hypothetical protein